MKIIIRVILFLIAAFSGMASYASHLVGGEITYKPLGNGKYWVIAKVYRDCRGIYFRNTMTAEISAKGCTTQSLSLTRTSIRDITNVCKSTPKPCDPQNTMVSNEGLEEHTFEDTVDFTKSPYKTFADNKCCEVYFGMGECCRRGTLTVPGDDFWVHSMVNICLDKMQNKINYSPEFITAPIMNGCCNRPIYGTFGAVDTVDRDSLSYELTYGFNGSGLSSITYNAPLSYLMPMSPYCPGKYPCTANPTATPPQGFYLDPTTGDFVFTPTSCSEVGFIVAQVNEFRRDSTNVWKKIGEIRRDFHLIISNCAPNNPAIISGTTKYNICAGEKLCFTIKATDKQYLPTQKKADTVIMFWNKGIPNATFKIKDTTAREKEAEFCWQTKETDAANQLYKFVVSASDDNCPFINISNKTFFINVKRRPKGVTGEITNKKCGWVHLKVKTKDSLLSNPGYRWEVYTLKLPSERIYISFSSNDSFQARNSDSLVVYLYASGNNNCWAKISIDTIKPALIHFVDLVPGKDTSVCINTQLEIKSDIKDGNGKLAYKWYKGFNKMKTFSFQDTNSNFIYKVTKDTALLLKVTDTAGCVQSDSMKIYVKQNVPITLNSIMPFCYKPDTINLTKMTAVVPIDAQFSTKRMNAVFYKNNSYLYKALDSPHLSAFDTIQIKYSNPLNKCLSFNEFVIRLNPLPQSVLNALNACIKSPLYSMKRMIDFPLDTNLLNYTWKCTKVPPGANISKVVSASSSDPKVRFINLPQINLAGNYSFRAIFKDSNTCVDSTETTIKVLDPNVEMKFTFDDGYCLGSKEFDLQPYAKFWSLPVTGPGKWKALTLDGKTIPSNPISGTIFSPKIKEGNWRLRYSDSAATCKVSVETSVYVYPLPTFSLGNDTTIEDNQSVIFYTPNIVSNFLWSNGTNYGSLRFTASLMDTGKKLIWLRATDKGTLCVFTDSLFIYVTHNFNWINSFKNSGIELYPNPAGERLNYSGVQINSAIRFFDFTGKVVLEVLNLNLKGVIDISRLKQGIYTIEVEFNHQKIRSQLVKI